MSKNSSSYGPSEQEKFFLSSHGPAPSGSSSGSGGGNSSSSSSSGLRPHGGLVTPVPLTGASHPSGIPIHQPSHGKGGSITSGHPIQHPQRAPPSTANHVSSYLQSWFCSHSSSSALYYRDKAFHGWYTLKVEDRVSLLPIRLVTMATLINCDWLCVPSLLDVADPCV